MVREGVPSLIVQKDISVRHGSCRCDSAESFLWNCKKKVLLVGQKTNKYITKGVQIIYEMFRHYSEDIKKVKFFFLDESHC